MSVELAYKIVEVRPNGQMLTLFHGINGSRKLHFDIWYDAAKRDVRDGNKGTLYLSGFHVLLSLDETIRFLNRFRAKRELQIIECLVDGIRPKSHSNAPIFLVDRVKLIRRVWPND